MKAAANDRRSWDGETLWFVCPCGGGDFWIKLDRRTGFHHVLCRQCEADHSMTVAGRA